MNKSTYSTTHSLLYAVENTNVFCRSNTINYTVSPFFDLRLGEVLRLTVLLTHIALDTRAQTHQLLTNSNNNSTEQANDINNTRNNNSRWQQQKYSIKNCCTTITITVNVVRRPQATDTPIVLANVVCSLGQRERARVRMEECEWREDGNTGEIGYTLSCYVTMRRILCCIQHEHESFWFFFLYLFFVTVDVWIKKRKKSRANKKDEKMENEIELQWEK